MFRCELCGLVPEFKSRGPRVVPAGERCVMVVVEKRPTEYPSRPKAQRRRVGRKVRMADDPGGAGYEIAKEVRSCVRCAHDYEKIRPAFDAPDDEGEFGFVPVPDFSQEAS